MVQVGPLGQDRSQSFAIMAQNDVSIKFILIQIIKKISTRRNESFKAVLRIIFLFSCSCLVATIIFSSASFNSLLEKIVNDC